ncbi:MAG: hypothetical protein LBE74_02200 [Treponema sp.]|nr:hypothetical protein [Treponema sp.]
MKYAPLVLSVLLFAACDIEGSNEITFVNKSQCDIENIWGASDDVIPLLRPGESVTNIVHGLSSDVLALMFYINGKVYGTEIGEEIEEAEGYRVQPLRRITDGERFTITVYSEYYWTIKKN